MKKVLILVLGFAMMVLPGCSTAVENTSAPVESYLQAIVGQDADRISTLACADWVDQALLELDSFMGVETSLQDVTCAETALDGDTATVACTGSIAATYNGEQQSFPLEGRQYKMVKEGGEWLVCGY